MLETRVVSHQIEHERSALISGIDVSIKNRLSDGSASQILNLLTNFSVESEYFFVFVLKRCKVDFHLLIVDIAVVAAVWIHWYKECVGAKIINQGNFITKEFNLMWSNSIFICLTF